LLLRRDNREHRKRGHKSGARRYERGSAIDETEEAYMSCVPVTVERGESRDIARRGAPDPP